MNPTSPNNTTRWTLLGVLAVVMAATRMHHFDIVPDASWAVFFIGGFYLRAWTRWAFPALMLLAVVIDYLVISSQGINFWTHYCVSPAYWCLVPAHFALWAGGSWLARRIAGTSPAQSLGWLAVAVLASVAVCHLIAQGSFYWISSSVADPTLAGWWKNYSDWLPAYLGTAAMYITIAAGLHVVVRQIAGQQVAAAGRP